MKFSLILCTLNRTREVDSFLKSLQQQTYKNFEVVIVDQNKDRRVYEIIQKYKNKLNIKYIHNKQTGLSNSRNLGLEYANSEIVAFPDDDCTYPPELLQSVFNFFKKNNYDILLGKTIEKETKKIVAGKNITKPQVLKPSLILGSSTTLFLRNKNEIVFDELFGLGSEFNSEEENELIFRLLKQGFQGYYEPDINYVYHPASDLDYRNYERAKKRAMGLGAFIAKHVNTKEAKIYFIKYNLIRPLSGSILALLKLNFMKSKFYFYRFIGIWEGFLKYYRIYR